jgi:hypothetical protein
MLAILLVEAAMTSIYGIQLTSEDRAAQELTVEDERILGRCVAYEIVHSLKRKFGFVCKGCIPKDL